MEEKNIALAAQKDINKQLMLQIQNELPDAI